MRYKIYFSILAGTLFFSSSCHRKPSALQKQNELRLETLERLSSKYHADMQFDTVEFPFTYQYQDLLKQNNKVIISNFIINDVVKDDSIVTLTLVSRVNSLFLRLTCTDDQIKRLLSVGSAKNVEYTRYDNVFIIATITSIHKIKFTLNTEINHESADENDPEPDVDLTLDTSDSFICKGKIDDMYINDEGPS